MNFIPQFEPIIKNKYIKEVLKQMKTGFVGCGKTVEVFESMLSNFTQCKYNIVTTSGTTAIIMALKSMELPENSTILFPSYTFLAAANAARFLNYKIKLVDIKEDTLCMDPEKIIITPEISCIIFVNHNGYIGNDILKIKTICEKNNIKMLEDSSQGFGIKNCGTTGNIGIYSFSVPKLITTGQGGLVFTNNDDLATEIKRIRDHGDNWRKTKQHDYLGVNFKFNDILAAYGISQLKDFEKIKKQKIKIFNLYKKEINIYQNNYEFPWMIIYKTNKAKQIIENLKNNNIQAVQYYKPISHNNPYKTNSLFPIAEKLYEQLVYLPSSLNLSYKNIKIICNIIKETEKCNLIK